MHLTDHDAWVMFLALFALYSPIAALSSYLPLVTRFSPADQRRLAIGLFLNVSIFVLLALWVGEPLLELLGLTTAALTVTGGVALMYEGVPMMRGTAEHPAVDEDIGIEGWRSIVFTPLTFPLTVGGTTFGLLVSFAASAPRARDGLVLTIAGLAYAAVTGLTLYAAGHVARRVSQKASELLERIAGILLTAIAVTLLFSGGTRMVVATLESIS